MDKEWMRRQLPEQPPDGLIKWTLKTFLEELGPEYMVFHSERVPIMPAIEEVMEYGDMRPRRYEWAAYCTCSACGESFYTQKVTGADAIRLAVGEDGMPYTLDPGEPYGPSVWGDGTHVEEAFDCEAFNCPLCFHKVRLIHNKKLRGGRTKRIMVQSVQNVEGYTTIFYWMVVRVIDEYGIDYVSADPMDAYVLTEKGGLVRYTHVKRYQFGSYSDAGSWFQTSRCDDKHDTPYQDWGSINNRKAGAVLYDSFPDLMNVTGEKTGILEYVEGGGFGLVQYLKFWRKYRSIENLVKSGQAPLVVSIFKRANRFCYSTKLEMEKYVDLKERKPHKMLRISKTEYRQLRLQGVALKAETLDLFQRYQKAGGKLLLPEFLETAGDFGTSGISAAMTVMEGVPGTDLKKIADYMKKQRMELRSVQYLVDTHRMARQAFGQRPLTDEELWPRNLMAAHDRMDQILAEQRRMKDQQAREEYNRKFGEVIGKYGHLQWTDGELCIVLPKTSQELHDEGQILRHCVGGYSKRHIEGSDVIFFVRKYRRPERSYYTLDICMNKGEPREVQLHGYGNERHGPHKQYSHRIPQKVRDFVDRWKREVLMPWWLSKVQSDIKEKSA